ncbi:protein S100-A9 [Onychomys torridus]|uniref:protein S100-A9 n=1 Tax=Onychomys torridus TaxID=38674 RepID=UPI00167F5C18|nr:protein S100-A9 [Onychomys torridus]
MATKTPSMMERNINTIIEVFHQHARTEGNTDTLSQKEFKNMVKSDLANFMKKEKKKEKLINDIMEDLDTNDDKQLAFEEFVMLVAKLVFATHEKMHASEQNLRGKEHSHGSGFGK